MLTIKNEQSSGTNHASSNISSSITSNHQSSLQPKKSRLLNDFYASIASSKQQQLEHSEQSTKSQTGSNKNNNENLLNQDSMHSTSSIDSRCSSVMASGSAGSPQPQPLESVGTKEAEQHQQRLAAVLSAAAAAAAAAAVSRSSSDANPQQQTALSLTKSSSNNGHLSHQSLGASTLSEMVNNLVASNRSSSLCNPAKMEDHRKQQALHESLVRSLIQFKQQQQNSDFLASFQQQSQQQKSLLESLASLSSVGTGSIVDQSSESAATERSSSPVSPDSRDLDSDENTSALNLAKSSKQDDDDLNLGHRKLNNEAQSKPDILGKRQACRQLDDHAEDDEDFGIDVDDEASDLRAEHKLLNKNMKHNNNIVDDHDNGKDDNDNLVNDHKDQASQEPGPVGSPLDGDKKVKKFLDDYHKDQELRARANKRPRLDINDIDHDHDDDVQREARLKRIAAADHGIKWLSRTLIIELCDRRGDRLDMDAISDAARYIECFLETLIDDAALIARHSSPPSSEHSSGEGTNLKDKLNTDQEPSMNNPIDSSSLSLALKLIPSKLMASIDQQQVKLESPHSERQAEAIATSDN